MASGGPLWAAGSQQWWRGGQGRSVSELVAAVSSCWQLLAVFLGLGFGVLAKISHLFLEKWVARGHFEVESKSWQKSRNCSVKMGGFEPCFGAPRVILLVTFWLMQAESQKAQGQKLPRRNSCTLCSLYTIWHPPLMWGCPMLDTFFEGPRHLIPKALAFAIERLVGTRCF